MLHSGNAELEDFILVSSQQHLCVSAPSADSFRFQDCFPKAVMQQGFQGKRIDHMGVDLRGSFLMTSTPPDTSGLMRLEPEMFAATNIDLSHSRQSACQV